MQKYAKALIVTAGVCWGCIGLFIRILNSFGVTAMQLVEARGLVAVVIIGCILFFYDKSLFKINIRHIWCFAGTGIVGIILFNLCYFTTIAETSLSVAAVLLYTAPIFVMLISAPLFGEKITKAKLVALAMAFAGCVLVSGVLNDAAVLSTKGLIIGLGAGVGYALYTVFARYALNYGYSSLTIQFYTFALAMCLGAFFTDFGQLAAAYEAHHMSFLAAIIGIGLISTTVPNLLYTTGMKYIDNGRTSVMASIEPVTAIIVGIVVFHEIPSLSGFIGIGLVLGALIVVNIGSSDESKRT